MYHILIGPAHSVRWRHLHTTVEDALQYGGIIPVNLTIVKQFGKRCTHYQLGYELDNDDFQQVTFIMSAS